MFSYGTFYCERKYHKIQRTSNFQKNANLNLNAGLNLIKNK